MTLLQNLPIGRRIGLAFVLTLLLMLVVAGFSASRLLLVNHSLRLVTEDYYEKVRLIAKIDAEINKQARFTRNLLIMQAGDERQGELRSIALSRTLVRQSFDQLTPMVRSEEGKRRLAAVMAARADYVRALDDFLPRVEGGAMEEARTLLLQNLRTRQLGYMEEMARFAALQEQLMAQASAAADHDARQGLWVAVSVSVGALLLSAVLGLWLTRSITRPLRRAVDVARTVAAGDLRSEIDAPAQD